MTKTSDLAQILWNRILPQLTTLSLILSLDLALLVTKGQTMIKENQLIQKRTLRDKTRITIPSKMQKMKSKGI
jgi:hypothetical protein